MDYLYQYGLFLGETITVTLAVIVVVATVVATAAKGRSRGRERLEVTKLNEHYRELEETIKDQFLDKQSAKRLNKQHKKELKVERKQGSAERKKLYILRFKGDMQASGVDELREEVTAVLTVARETDEVLVCLESPGGMVHAYGLAASQLSRIRDRGIPLTVAVDQVAASGGYLMACVANRIVSAPFAIIGSIGVVAQLPNLHRFLKKHDIDYELLTAGEYKRTLTVFGENTPEGRKKAQEELETTHRLFKDFIGRYRPQVSLDDVATGEYWLGEQAFQLRLVDTLKTSDDYLMEQHRDADLLEIRYHRKRPLTKRLSLAFESALNRAGTAAGGALGRSIDAKSGPV